MTTDGNYSEIFFDCIKQVGYAKGEANSPNPKLRRWIELSVSRPNSMMDGELGEPLNRFAFGPFYWKLQIFDFDHNKHNMDDDEYDYDCDIGITERIFVCEMVTTELDDLVILLKKHAPNQDCFTKANFDYPM